VLKQSQLERNLNYVLRGTKAKAAGLPPTGLISRYSSIQALTAARRLSLASKRTPMVPSLASIQEIRPPTLMGLLRGKERYLAFYRMAEHHIDAVLGDLSQMPLRLLLVGVIRHLRQ
jgi:hypothetical protein